MHIRLLLISFFLQFFPDPQTFKKPSAQATRAGAKPKPNPYQPVIDWFGKGHEMLLLQDVSDEVYQAKLYSGDGLYSAVKQFYPNADEAQASLLMEFLLHGLSEFSLISKKGVEAGGYAFGDILGSMLNMNFGGEEDEEE